MSVIAISDVELARRCRSRVKTHQAFILLYEAEHTELKQADLFGWRQTCRAHPDLSRDLQEVVWFESSKHKAIKAEIEETKKLIKWHREKIEKIEECAQALDLTIED